MNNLQKKNYQIEMEKEINSFGKMRPKLLLHSCCAPCSSYVLEYLSKYFDITVFFYNPNINIPGEYELRKMEQIKLINQMKTESQIGFIEGEFNAEDFLDKIKGLEAVSEGGERCLECYSLRLEKSAQITSQQKFDYFTTSLTISPMKNSNKLNEIGISLEKKYGIKWLRSDFKKKNGYKRSVELSIEHKIYRQDYCGCSFSKLESDKRKSTRENRDKEQ